MKLYQAFVLTMHMQFDALVGALPITEEGEEAQLKLIAKLQVRIDI